MTVKNDFSEFKNLLRQCIGSRSQKEFAEASGLSPEHISRMLKDEPISRPSKSTLSKILNASAATNVTYFALFNSCGYNEQDSQFSALSSRRKMDLYKQMELVSRDISSGFQSIIEKSNIFNNLGDAIKLFMEQYNVNISKMSLYDGPQDSKFLDKSGESYICGKAIWSSVKDDTTKNVVTTFFVLFFVETTRGGFILTDVATDGATLSKCQAMPQPFLDSLYEDGLDVDNLDFFAIASEKPYKKSESVERLLKCIFGENEEDEENNRKLGHTEYGFGFTYKETPRDFVPFLLHHAEAFCNSEEETELFEEFDELVKSQKDVDVDEYFEKYAFKSAKGTAAVVFAIMYREMKDVDIDVDYGESDEYADVLQPCIYVNELSLVDDTGHIDKLKKKVVDASMMKYARELHMPTYGSTIVYNIHSVQITGLQDAIEYNN